jgi:hypothetical protein
MATHQTRFALVIGAALALAACATTEVSQWAAPPGQEILIGQGGAFDTMEQDNRKIDVWTEGSPNRPFKIIAKAKSTYSYGMADKGLARDAAKKQLVAAVIAKGGDAVVFGGESTGTVGAVYVPGTQTTTVTPTYGGGARATTTSTPGMAGTIGEGTIHAYIIRYADRP